MVAMRTIHGRAILGALALAGLVVVAACGDGGPSDPTTVSDTSTRSAATGRERGDAHVVTEADAGAPIQTEHYVYDIGLPDRKGMLLVLTGDDASTLRWRFVQKPERLVLDWYAVDDELAFETDGLVGSPTTAAKTLEFRGNIRGTTDFVLELVEMNPADRVGGPAKRLEYSVEVVPSAMCNSGAAEGVC